jgi:hypothetical protein
MGADLFYKSTMTHLTMHENGARPLIRPHVLQLTINDFSDRYADACWCCVIMLIQFGINFGQA